jgi:hypothetical protein
MTPELQPSITLLAFPFQLLAAPKPREGRVSLPNASFSQWPDFGL